MSEFRDQHDQTPKHTPRTPDHEAEAGHDHGLGLASTLGNSQVGQVLSSPGVQRAGATSAQQLDESVARAIEDRRGRGAPLDDDTRTEMEGALGHDLSDVRVHTDSTAHELNESVSARAFTTGSDVFFKQGTYDPGSSSGRELLGHELTHVVQQREGTSGLAAGEVSHPADAAEQHAEAVGRTLADGAATPAATSAPGGAQASVAREADEELEEPVAGAWEAGGIQRQDDEELEEPMAGAWEPGVQREAEEELEEETA